VSTAPVARPSKRVVVRKLRELLDGLVEQDARDAAGLPAASLALWVRRNLDIAVGKRWTDGG
jgi:hypothetical protein